MRAAAQEYDLGHVLDNDAEVLTELDPGTLRGPDVAFYSYARLPRGPLPAEYGPELVLEVLSPDDRWPKVLARAAEYLEAGVSYVGVLDPDERIFPLYCADYFDRILHADDAFTLSEILDEFHVRVGQFFE